MKTYRHLLILFFATFLITNLNAQEFGIKGGLNITFFKVVEGDFGTNPDTETGVYGGIFADFEFENNFHLQLELIYAGVGELNFVDVPIYVKYDATDTFHVLVGPSLNYFFDLFANNFKVRADLSFEYDFSPGLNMHMKYTFGLEELSPNILFIGLGYRL